MSALTPEIRDFLAHGTRTGKLGFVAADGRPLVAPVWFVVHRDNGRGDDSRGDNGRGDEAPGDEIWFNTARDTAKGKAVRRDPRLVLCVDLEAPPYAFVQVQGVATVSEDPDELVASATAIGARYMGADRAEDFGKRNGVPGELLVKLRPTKVVADMDITG
jgi:PPOX class probable F420-dependent enzyme